MSHHHERKGSFSSHHNLPSKGLKDFLGIKHHTLPPSGSRDESCAGNDRHHKKSQHKRSSSDYHLMKLQIESLSSENQKSVSSANKNHNLFHLSEEFPTTDNNTAAFLPQQQSRRRSSIQPDFSVKTSHKAVAPRGINLPPPQSDENQQPSLLPPPSKERRHKRSVSGSDFEALKKQQYMNNRADTSARNLSECEDFQISSLCTSSAISTELMSTDNVSHESATTPPLIHKWDENVDVSASMQILKSLNKYIAETVELLMKEKSERTNQVGDFLSSMTNPDSKENSESHIKRQFAEENKQSNKVVKDLQTKLDSLNYRKAIIEDSGIPHGVNPKEYVKNLTRDKSKKKATSSKYSDNSEVTPSLSRMHKERSPFAQKSSPYNNKVHRSASDENLAAKKIDSAYSSGTDRTSNSLLLSSIIGHDSKKRGPSSLHNFMPNVVTSSTPKSSHHQVSNNNTESSSVLMRKPGHSHTSSQSYPVENETQNYPDNKLCSDSGHKNCDQSVRSGDSPPDESTHSDPARESYLSGSGSTHNMMIKDEALTLRKELFDAKQESNQLREQIETLKRDMKTTVELSKQQNQNSAERVERLEVLVDESNLKMQREFTNFKEDFRNLNEKLDYRLITLTRDLRDNIESVSNSLNLLGNKVEQLPHLGDGRKDPLIVYDNIWNAGVSLAALLMVIISGCFQLLIRFVNFGAAVVQHRTLFTSILVPVTLYFIIKTYWPSILDNFSDFLQNDKESFTFFKFFKKS